MAEPRAEGERRAFVGMSRGAEGDPASLNDALSNAAAAAVEGGAVTKDRPAWYDIAGMQVEIANQHIRTFRVIVTPHE